MSDWGRKMFVTPGVVVDGKLVTNDLVDINLGIRILLGHSYYEDWAESDREVFVDAGPARQPGRRAAPVEPAHDPEAAEARLRRQRTRWTMSPRWFDGTDHLALDTGGGPIARLWSTALTRPGRRRLREGHRQQRRDQPAAHGAQARGHLRVEDPEVEQRTRAQPRPHLLPGVRRCAGAALLRQGAGRGPCRPHRDLDEVRGARRGRQRAASPRPSAACSATTW